ncbi:hypothetical protein FJZ48_02930, partial [Candidatus Uhrbacteria bacterium]|nr:hypothetical protein [Candidatus Uhrbacteria bacterium]
MKEPVVFSSISVSGETLDPKHATQAVWEYVISVKSLLKRDGRTEPFQPEKLERAVSLAFKEAGITSPHHVRKTTEHIVTRLQKRFDGHTVPTADEVREMVALTLIDENLSHVAKKYLTHRSGMQRASEQPVYGRGITVPRFYTKEGVLPYDEIHWEKRDAVITNEKGKVVFEQREVEVPSFYSQTATNIIVSKYFRGRIGTPQRETSVSQ